MKQQEIVTMMDIKEDQQVQPISFLMRKQDQERQQQAKQERVNEQLAKEIHKPVTKKIKRRKVYARFKDNIWAADLAVTESLSSKNKNIKYLLCAIDVFTKYAWVKLLKDKKGKTVLNAFFKTVYESNHKPNKLWVDQG